VTSTALSRVRGSVISWLGIVGGAITLFGNLQAVVDLADWARWIVLHYRLWIFVFWDWIFYYLQININRELIPYLTLAVSQILISIGAKLGSRENSKEDFSASAFVNVLFVLTPWTILYLLITGPKGFLTVQLYRLIIYGNIDDLKLWERALAFVLLLTTGFVAMNIAPSPRAFGSRLWLMLSFLGVILAMFWISLLGISTKSPNL
jgi:hypothetical protein